MRHFSNTYELSKIILEEAICIEKTGVILAGEKILEWVEIKPFRVT